MSSDRLKGLVLIVALAAFFAFPLVWILIVSLQPGDVAYAGRYQLLPDNPSAAAYREVLLENRRGIRDALGYSLAISTVATAIATFLALSAVYVVRADSVSSKWRKRTVNGSIGLFFLPAFAVFPGVRALARVLNLTEATSLQLIAVHSVFGFAVAFVLLLLIFGWSRNAQFEQLLLESGSRIRAFLFGVIAPDLVGTVVVAGLTFATIWSEFFLSSLITAHESTKPFSVVLQMARGQYRTDYSVFAAGAGISFLMWLGMTFALAATAVVAWRVVMTRGTGPSLGDYYD